MKWWHVVLIVLAVNFGLALINAGMKPVAK